MDKKALIAQISHNVAERATMEGNPPKPARVKKPTSREVTKTPKAKKSSTTGKPAAFWVDDSDRQIFHELGMLLYTQGIKPSDSLILRAAIRLMPRDHRFIEQIRALQTQDGRKLRHQGDASAATARDR